MSEDECKRCSYRDAAGRCRAGLLDDDDYFLPWVNLYFSGEALAPYVPTPCRVVLQMLSSAEVKADEMVYDLGSGDGRILMLAAGIFGARAVGFELETDLVKKALDKIRELHLEDKVKVIPDDLFKADTGKADVVTMYLTPRGNEEVKPKLERELRPGARVVSLEFEILGWSPLKVSRIVDAGLTYTIYVYKR